MLNIGNGQLDHAAAAEACGTVGVSVRTIAGRVMVAQVVWVIVAVGRHRTSRIPTGDTISILTR